jgi:hypothetical protein
MPKVTIRSVWAQVPTDFDEDGKVSAARIYNQGEEVDVSDDAKAWLDKTGAIEGSDASLPDALEDAGFTGDSALSPPGAPVGSDEMPTLAGFATDDEIDQLSGVALDDACEQAGIDYTAGGSLQDGSMSAAEKRDALKARPRV